MGILVLGILAVPGASALLEPSACAAGVKGRLYIDGEEATEVAAGQPLAMSFQFRDAETNETLHHYMVMHGKECHLIAVSQDLSRFAHVHPYRDGEHATVFKFAANQKSDDPDNFDSVRVIPAAGKYLLFAELMPHEYPMVTVPFDLTATGDPVAAVPLVLDPLSGKNEITREFGEGAESGYRVRLKWNLIPHCGTFLGRFMAHIELLDPKTGMYGPVTDLEPWLTMYGHGILLTQAGDTAAVKSFHHIHAISPLDGSQQTGDVVLFLDNHGGNPIVEGVHKFWLQVKHRDVVLTFPFVFDLRFPAVAPGAGTGPVIPGPAAPGGMPAGGGMPVPGGMTRPMSFLENLMPAAFDPLAAESLHCALPEEP